MRQIIESLKRLYQSNSIDDQKVIELLKDKKITENEKEYILNK